MNRNVHVVFALAIQQTLCNYRKNSSPVRTSFLKTPMNEYFVYTTVHKFLCSAFKLINGSVLYYLKKLYSTLNLRDNIRRNGFENAHYDAPVSISDRNNDLFILFTAIHFKNYSFAGGINPVRECTNRASQCLFPLSSIQISKTRLQEMPIFCLPRLNIRTEPVPRRILKGNRGGQNEQTR